PAAASRSAAPCSPPSSVSTPGAPTWTPPTRAPQAPSPPPPRSRSGWSRPTTTTTWTCATSHWTWRPTSLRYPKRTERSTWSATSSGFTPSSSKSPASEALGARPSPLQAGRTSRPPEPRNRPRDRMENPVYGEGYTQASWWERWLTKMIEDIPLWAAWAGTLLAAVLAITALVTGVIVTRRAVRTITRYVRALTHGRSAEDILTVVAATIATGVSAQGMWNFFGDVLHVIWPLRLVFFAFIEVAVGTSAVRARRSMREKYSAGIDGIAVWALATLTAVLSALDAASHAEAVFRLAAPLVAAWLWERGMALERRRITGL